MFELATNKTRPLTAKQYLAQYPATSQPMELINGEVITMPAPLDRHSAIVSNVMWVLQAHVRPQKLGQVRTEPTDVHFDDYNVLQPDVLFIHKESPRCKVAADGYLHGVPDLCVEVLSKSTAKLDRTDKFDIYEKYGVGEYWMIDPELRLVEVYHLVGDYLQRKGAYDESKTFESSVLPTLMVSIAAIFEGLDNPTE